MSESLRILLIIGICTVCTQMERALPFLLFRGKEIPGVVRYLGKALPMAIMMTLVIYCLKDIQFVSLKACLPQLIAAVVTAGLHLWKRNTFLSIFAGTVVCMVLTQLVF